MRFLQLGFGFKSITNVLLRNFCSCVNWYETLLTASFNCSFFKFPLLFIVAKFLSCIFACGNIIATVTFSTSFLLLEEIYFLTGYFLLYNIDSSVLFGWLF